MTVAPASHPAHSTRNCLVLWGGIVGFGSEARDLRGLTDGGGWAPTTTVTVHCILARRLPYGIVEASAGLSAGSGQPEREWPTTTNHRRRSEALGCVQVAEPLEAVDKTGSEMLIDNLYAFQGFRGRKLRPYARRRCCLAVNSDALDIALTPARIS